MNHMTVQAIAAEARATIARQNVPQARVAEALGLTRSQFSRRINGHIEFSASEIATMADFLGVPVGEFFPADPVPA
jgi:transcriptional regulator with XRE-family HTH domain